MYDTNKKVIAFHEQVMKEFEDSSDRPHYLIQNSVTPSTLRFNKGWKLDGIDHESSYDYSE